MKTYLNILFVISIFNFAPAHADGMAEEMQGHSVAGSDSNAQADDVPPSRISPPACDFSSLVGQKADSIDRAQFGERVVRTLKPDQAVTMEYLEGRINLLVDDAGIITQVTCG